MADNLREDLEVTGLYVNATIAYLRRACGDEGVARALELAGEVESALPDDEGWIALDRVMAITDAAASLVGSPDLGRLVGEELFAANVAIGMDEVIRASGGPVEALSMLTAYGSRIAGGWTLEVTNSGDHFAEITSVSKERPTSPFFCSMGVGYYSQVPGLFGMVHTTIVHPECLARGDRRCHYIVRWVDPGARRRGKSFDAVTHFERLHEVSAQLAAAATSHEVVQLAAAMATQVTFGRRFIVHAEVDADGQIAIAHHGFTSDEDAEGALAQIEQGDGNDEDDQVRCVVPLNTSRGDYGWIAAFHPPRSTIDSAVRRSLAGYARNVASALEAAINLETAHRDRDTAHTLASFAHELAGATTAEEVAQLVEVTLLSATECTSVTTWLVDDTDQVLRNPITDSIEPITSHSRRWGDAPERWIATDPGQIHQLHPGRTDIATSTVVPLMARGSILGSIAVGWSHPDAPTTSAAERLEAIVDQAALAFDVVHLLRDLHQQARHDPLSGLANRAMLAERAEHAMSQAKRSGRQIGLLFIDLDGFKAVNDEFGHAAGDEVICQVADRLVGIVRAHDTVARLGGDEFVVLLSECDGAHDAEAAARRVAEVMQPPFVAAGSQLSLSAAIGVLATHPREDTWHSLLDRADAAMYVGKQQGNNSVTTA